MSDILIYADFDLITVLRSQSTQDNTVKLTESASRYNKQEFKQNWVDILGIEQLNQEATINLFTNLMTASPIYEELDKVCQQTWIARYQFWQNRFIEYNKTLSRSDNIEQAIALMDLYASDLVEWSDKQMEARAIGYLRRFKKDETIEDGLLPYLYWLKYCSDGYYSMWLD